MLSSVSVRRTILPLLGISLLCLQGCGSDLADDPLFNDQQAAVQRIDEELKTLRSQVEDQNRAVSNLVVAVENLKGEPLTGAEPGQRLEQRVQVLEEAIRKSNQTLGEFREQIDPRSAASTASAARPAATSAPEAASSPAEPSTARVTLRRSPTPSPTPKPAAGFYYTVRSGDTISAIAERYNVSAEKLRTGNHIPSGREPFPGQQIYISK